MAQFGSVYRVMVSIFVKKVKTSDRENICHKNILIKKLRKFDARRNFKSVESLNGEFFSSIIQFI